MKILRLSFISLLFSAIALILIDQILYRFWYIPEANQLEIVPIYYNYIMLLPMIITVIIFALAVSTWLRICLVALMFTVSHQILDFLSAYFGYAGYLQNFAMSDEMYIWTFRPVMMFCIYLAALTIVWFVKIMVRNRHTEKSEVLEKSIEKKDLKGDNQTPERITYHVVPDPDGWRVKRGKAKKASSAHPTKEDALRAASDVAKSHPLSQVIVHKSTGVIESDRTYNYKHYLKKRKKKEISKKIRKGLKRVKRRKSEQRLRRRKAAKLGIARLRRKQYLKRTVKKSARRKKK